MECKMRFLIYVCIVSLASVGFAEEAIKPAKAAADVNKAADIKVNDANQVKTPTFPYDAIIADDNVHVRSGPGTNYYSCAKLRKGDSIKIVDSQYSWSRLVPPEGSFSWISKQFVIVEPNAQGNGIVNGDDVRIYAGSESLKPIHSTSLQVKLKKGDKVKVLGEEEGNYYKITPPEGAYLWVSTAHTEPVALSSSTTPAKQCLPDGMAGEKNAVLVPTKISNESKKLVEFHELEKQIKAEQAKSYELQDYTAIKKSLLEIAGDKEAGRAGNYAKFTLKQIERYEMANEVAKTVKLQDDKLDKVKQEITKAGEAKKAQIQQADLSKFAVVGKLQASAEHGPEYTLKHYIIVDEGGKTVCYAAVSDKAGKVDVGKFVGHKVGLVGTIEAHPEITGALVRFTEITELK